MEGVVGDHLWYASVGCAGFPPTRERRGGGAGTTSGRRGNDVRNGGSGRPGGCWRSFVVCECWLRWVPAYAGMTRGRRGNDEWEARERREEGAGATRGGGAGTTTRGRRGNDELCKRLRRRESSGWPPRHKSRASAHDRLGDDPQARGRIEDHQHEHGNLTP